MKKHKFRIFALFLALMLSGMLTACGSASGKTETTAPKTTTSAATKAAGADTAANASDGTDNNYTSDRRINIATATTGGAMYPAGVSLAQLLTDEGVFLASATTSGGSVENISLLQNDEAQVGFVQTNTLEDAYNGANTFDGKAAFSDLRILTPFQTSYHYLVVRKDAGIKSVSDLAGKRYVIGSAGSGGATTALCILDAFGMTSEDIDAQALGQSEAIEALKNGQADAAMIVGGLPLSQITDLLLTNSDSIEILTYSEEDQKRIHEANSWIMPMTVPAGTYSNQEEDWLITGHIVYLTTTADAFTDEEAYAFLKTTYANQDYIISALASMDSPAFMNPENYLEATCVPLHPGAEQYFKDQGLLN